MPFTNHAVVIVVVVANAAVVLAVANLSNLKLFFEFCSNNLPITLMLNYVIS